MKFIVLIALVLHSSYSIDVKFDQFYFKGIKRIEIPSCDVEPCILKIGQQLPAKITFEAEFTNETKFEEITDASIRVYVNYYRDTFQYDLAKIKSVCKIKSIKCPVVKGQNYTIDVQLFIQTEDSIPGTQMFPETGLKDVYFDVDLYSKNGAEIIGIAKAKINVQ